MAEEASNNPILPGFKDAAEGVKTIVELKPVDKILTPVSERLASIIDKTLRLVENVITLPIDILNYKIERQHEFMFGPVAEKLENVPSENIIPPSPQILFRVLEDLDSTPDDPNLREMFAKLIAASMTSDKASSVSPAMVETLKQLSPQDAKTLLVIYESTVVRLVDTTIHHDKDSEGRTVQTLFQTLLFPSELEKSFNETNGELFISLEHLRLVSSELGASGSGRRDNYESELANNSTDPLVHAIRQQLGILRRDNPGVDITNIVYRYSNLRLTLFGKRFCALCLGN